MALLSRGYLSEVLSEALLPSRKRTLPEFGKALQQTHKRFLSLNNSGGQLEFENYEKITRLE